MGTEISLPKIRAVSPCDGSMNLRIQNNYHPLHFHQVHGDNIELLKNKTVARRHEGFCKGIAFSDRPVSLYEPVYVKFLDISSNWSGALRIGFTANDPSSMKSKLPRYACPDLTSMQGNWAKAIAERMAKKNSVLYYYVDQNGDVHYGIDSEEHGIFFGGINTSGKLWAVIDIYGNTVAVEFMEPNSLTQDCINESQSNLISLASENGNQTDLADCIPSSIFDLSFHSIHGKNVLLKTDRHIASRKAGCSSSAYIFTQRPLNLNEKVVVQVCKTENNTSGSLIYGITSCNPSTIDPNDLPMNADDLLDRLEYWVVKQDSNTYKMNDYIMYSISDEGEVVVRKNWGKSAIFHVDQTQPLWLFLNICGAISEVRLIGTVSYDLDITNKFENLFVSLPSKTQNKDEIPGPSSQQNYTECVICYEESTNCALYRCGHVCMCYDCACKIWKPNSNVQCPICRELIQDIIKIYT